jgi:hypothetical protein
MAEKIDYEARVEFVTIHPVTEEMPYPRQQELF